MLNIAEGRPPGLQLELLPTLQIISQKLYLWIEELTLLSALAKSQPHAVCSTFMHGVISKCFFIAKTIPDISSCYQHLELCIQTTFIPAVIGQSPPGDLERNLLALHATWGSLIHFNCHLSNLMLPLKALNIYNHSFVPNTSTFPKCSVVTKVCC